MRLTEVAGSAGVIVFRDGEFRNLGFVGDDEEWLLVFLESDRFAATLTRNQNIRAVLTTAELAGAIPGHLALGVCEQPRVAFAAIHNNLAQTGFYWEEFETVIDPRAKVHETAWIAPKNVRVGPGSCIGPQAAILERCVIGEGCTVGAGSILGGVGFQTLRENMLEMAHAGGLTVGDRVHVLPGAIIATGLFRRNTEIGSDARIGSRAFISHAVQVGERAIVGHGAVVNGHVEIGKQAWIGPGAVIANNLEIGEGAFVSLGSVVIRNVPPDAKVSGNFAISHQRWLRFLAALEPEGDQE